MADQHPHVDRLSDLRDGLLDDAQQEALLEHLSACETCRARAAAIGALGAALRHPMVDDLPPSSHVERLESEIMARVWSETFTEGDAPRWRWGLAFAGALAAVTLLWMVWPEAARWPQAPAAVAIVIEAEGVSLEGSVVSTGQRITLPGPKARLDLRWPNQSARGHVLGESEAEILGPVAAGPTLKLHRGRVLMHVQPGVFTDETPFAVRTPDATITVKGTVFEIVHDDTGTTVKVARGLVEVSGPHGTIDVGTGQMLPPSARAPRAMPESEGASMLEGLGLPAARAPKPPRKRPGRKVRKRPRTAPPRVPSPQSVSASTAQPEPKPSTAPPLPEEAEDFMRSGDEMLKDLRAVEGR
ncbi:MAG: FecR domain-containing protein [Bradymonadia bacterium]